MRNDMLIQGWGLWRVWSRSCWQGSICKTPPPLGPSNSFSLVLIVDSQFLGERPWKVAVALWSKTIFVSSWLGRNLKTLADFFQIWGTRARTFQCFPKEIVQFDTKVTCWVLALALLWQGSRTFVRGPDKWLRFKIPMLKSFHMSRVSSGEGVFPSWSRLQLLWPQWWCKFADHTKPLPTRGVVCMHSWLVRKWDRMCGMRRNFGLRFRRCRCAVFVLFSPFGDFVTSSGPPMGRILSLDPIGNQGKYLQCWTQCS